MWVDIIQESILSHAEGGCVTPSPHIAIALYLIPFPHGPASHHPSSIKSTAMVFLVQLLHNLTPFIKLIKRGPRHYLSGLHSVKGKKGTMGIFSSFTVLFGLQYAY